MDLSSTVTIVAPSASDGRGESAQLNGNTTDTHFVGYLWDASGFDGASVRLSQDDIVEGYGAVFGSFYHGVREFTLLLSPDRFDFARNVKVIVNGRVAFDGRVEKSVATLAKWAARDNDRTMLFAAELKILP